MLSNLFKNTNYLNPFDVVNSAVAYTGIKAKTKLEDWGIMNKNKFAGDLNKYGGMKKSDQQLVDQTL